MGYWLDNMGNGTVFECKLILAGEESTYSVTRGRIAMMTINVAVAIHLSGFPDTFDIGTDNERGFPPIICMDRDIHIHQSLIVEVMERNQSPLIRVDILADFCTITLIEEQVDD